MADEFMAVVKGVGEVRTALEKMQLASDEATRVALGKATAYTKRRIKGGMRGAPRWASKGDDPESGSPAFSLGRKPNHIPRAGGPGQLTGELYQSIRKSKRARRGGTGEWSQVVMAGGRGGYQNRYKAEIESKYPYFKPGVDKASPKVRGIFEGAWATAVNGKKF
jgi:hypothetical protein